MRKSSSKKGKFVFSFGASKAEGREEQRQLLGGKGANLHGMTRLGLPVPPGFTISTDVCAHFFNNKKTLPKQLKPQVNAAMTKVEKIMKRKFGGAESPLLVSVRSGAPVSMPGMMDTILNLGLNDKTVQGLIAESKDERFSYDSYRRFVAMYSSVVLGLEMSLFETALENLKMQENVENDHELSGASLKELVSEFKKIVKLNGKKFPEDPWEQLWGAVGAVFSSWMNPRAITYRKLNDISADVGTAVNVQAMVFGNMGSNCATGVAFTRDPSTGTKRFFGEFLINAQGEDVVAGIRTPHPINSESVHGTTSGASTMEAEMPATYQELVKLYKKLEKHFRDMQDIEFTVEKGKLYLLQTRNGKRTATAALKIAVDMVKEKLITKDEAILRIQPEQLDQLLHPRLDPNANRDVLAVGLPASPGAAAGEVVFDSDQAEKLAKEHGKKVILVRLETSPEDINGMASAQGILTARGGMTSHAAVVARGMGKCCIAGCSSLKIDYAAREFSAGERVVKEGDFITLDGTSGEVILGKIPTIMPALDNDFQELMRWVDQRRKLKVRTNADNGRDSEVARTYGAEGIGLCRTEHMFFDQERIDSVREMILADNDTGRIEALKKILPMQRGDFVEIFRAMKGLPVTIRLLDPPLHEFIPHTDSDLRKLSEKIDVSYDRLHRKAESLKEFNPMLGHRGCRLGISFPEIYRTQVRAIVEAACEVYERDGIRVEPEIMIPLVGHWKELALVREFCEDEIAKVLNEYKQGGRKVSLKYKIGTMIELPRAALTAAEIAEHADFFSFGTNDLTQTAFGLSRDDSGLFLKDYLDHHIYEKDPFAVLDQIGVGRLLNLAAQEGRAARKNLKVGICGEHGGEPASVEFCHNLGLDYVSCSPFRVPIARLAAAQAVLKTSSKKSSKKSKR